MKLLIYGSSVNGLCSKNNSDLDISVICPDLDIPNEDLLEQIKQALCNPYNKTSSRSRFRDTLFKEIKNGWLLKLEDISQEPLIEVDMMVNKVVEVYNSYLLSTYAKLDLRFLKMALLLKQWNKN